MQIITIPCLEDNFAYLLICSKSRNAAVVDPSESIPVKKMVEKYDVQLTTILNTHHHWDHVGGNKELKSEIPDLKIYAHESDRGRIPEQNVFLRHGDKISFGKESGSFLYNPGHTSGAITYIFDKTAFTGDTLFAAGCGRLFEGTAEQMFDSLNNKIKKLPDETQIYFGHEYTESNLNFALSVEPQNPQIQKRILEVKSIRDSGGYTCPTTIREEKKTNPFLRCSSNEICEKIKSIDPNNNLSEKEIFKTLRELKDCF